MHRRRPSMKWIELEATIGELAPGGDGVALAEVEGERRAIFVPGVAVGDRVRLDVDATRRPARGIVKDLLVPSADRVEPPCPVAARCGGCDWMHLSAEAQRKGHLEHIRRALPPRWQEGAPEIRLHPASEPLGYRVRARVHVRRNGGRIVLGMNEAGTHEPVEVQTCQVLVPALDRARLHLASLLEGATGRGDAQLALGQHSRPVLDLCWTGDLPGSVFARLEQAVSEGTWAGARVFLGDVSRPAVVGDPTPWMRGADGAPLRLAPGGFGQASESANAALVARVAEMAAARSQDPGAGRVVELYAGAGNLTVLLARDAPDMVAVESEKEACEAARANLAARGLRAKIVQADAATYAYGPATRLLVLDPPRTGAKEVAERLVEAPVKHVIYVSCDAQTLKRDLAILSEAYGVSAIDVFEMFPQTSHFETVVALHKLGAHEPKGARP